MKCEGPNASLVFCNTVEVHGTVLEIKFSAAYSSQVYSLGGNVLEKEVDIIATMFVHLYPDAISAKLGTSFKFKYSPKTPRLH